MRTIGVIGCGVVGGAVASGFEKRGFTVRRYDKFKPEFENESVLTDAEALFLCLPTPTRDDGTQDLTAVEDALKLIKRLNYAGTVVLKSTVLPGTTTRLASKFEIRRMVHNPEFLTAAKPLDDFLTQPAVLIGSKTYQAAIDVADIYYDAGFKQVTVSANPHTTELAKYMHNVFLATKVIFCNEIYEVCGRLNADYDLVARMAVAMGQIGEGHTRVPGPDKKFGFGGACFPKDVKAFYQFTKDIDIRTDVIPAMIDANNARRGQESA